MGCYSVMISSRNWGVFLKCCVFTYTSSAVITVFNVNPVVFFIFFLSLSAICFVILDNLLILTFIFF